MQCNFMSLTFLGNGLLTTLQDLGRSGYRRFGINPNGAMDKKAVRLVNILLGNNENEAVLEIHFPAPKILFQTSTVFALGGANFGAEIDKTKIGNWRPVFVKADSVLSFPEKISGNRIYLAVKGGFKIEKWLGSASTNLTANIGGFHGRAIKKDDQIFYTSKSEMLNVKFPFSIANNLLPRYSNHPTVRVVAGAEFEDLIKRSKENFFAQYFKIKSESNRMGFRLAGENLTLKKNPELVSAAVDFGTIQLLPNGQLIILMADHQTTGGYPRLAHVVAEDLPLAAQLGANDSINFKLISIEEAENLQIETERELNLLRTAVKFKH